MHVEGYWACYILEMANKRVVVFDPNPLTEPTEVIEKRHTCIAQSIVDACMYCIQGVPVPHHASSKGWRLSVRCNQQCPRSVQIKKTKVYSDFQYTGELLLMLFFLCSNPLDRNLSLVYAMMCAARYNIARADDKKYKVICFPIQTYN